MDTNKQKIPWVRWGGRKMGLARWLALFVLLLAIHWYPVRFGSLRLLMVVSMAALWAGALWLVWPYKSVRRVGLVLSVLVLGFGLWPFGAQNPQTLRQEYVHALKQYDGTRYIWGGENKRGIDCSGLIRCALIDANLKQGLLGANPAALREGVALWWNDCSAKALQETYQGKTRRLFSAPALNTITDPTLQPGDIAVTSDGVHVLAYLGEQTWIEADPNPRHGDRVIQVKVPTDNVWFDMPVSVMRWRQLE